jgi:urea transport system permease protein
MLVIAAMFFGYLLFPVSLWASETGQAATYESIVPQLVTGSYQEKESLISQLSALEDERLVPLFGEMMEGRLHYTKQDSRIVFISEAADGYALRDAVTDQDLGVVGKRELKKVRVNNKLRGMLRGEIAKLSLKSKRASVREAAVIELLQDLDPESTGLLRGMLPREQDEHIRQLIDTALAIDDISAADQHTRLAAIAVLEQSLYPEARQALLSLVKKTDAGDYVETDYSVRRAAQSALQLIESRVRINGFAETVFFGLSLGSVLLLSAIGLAITFGVMGVINMAHGEMMMLGAYTTYMVQVLLPDFLEYSLIISIPAAFLVAGAFGVAIERGVIRFLYGRPLETLLATFGVSLILQQLVRTTISAQNVIVSTPQWMSGSLQLNPILSITFNRLYIILFSLMVFFALLYVLKKTILGLQVRAVSQNRAMAKAMGVRSDWVDALTFGLGSGIAGIAGVALSQLTNVGPNLGQSYIIDSFMVVVFGGVGNLWGTLVGALSLGVVNKFLEPWSGAVLAKIFVLVFIILFIQKRPRGLFPQKGRSAEN